MIYRRIDKIITFNQLFSEKNIFYTLMLKLRGNFNKKYIQMEKLKKIFF